VRILLDTNIVVDFLTKRQPWYQDTIRLFDLMARGAFEGYVSAHAIITVDYIARKQIKETSARRGFRSIGTGSAVKAKMVIR